MRETRFHRAVLVTALHLWLLFHASMASAQSARADSMAAKLKTEGSTITRVDLLNSLAFEEMRDLNDTGRIQMLSEAQALATELGYAKGLAFGPVLTGERLRLEARYPEALAAYKEGIARMDALGMPQGLNSPLARIRQLYNSMGAQEERRAYYQQALQRYERMGLKLNIGTCHHGLGGYYIVTRQYALAVEQYLKAREIFIELEPHTVANETTVIGRVYQEWGNPDRARHFLEEGLQAFMRAKSKRLAAIALISLGDLELGQGDTLKAQIRYASVLPLLAAGDRTYKAIVATHLIPTWINNGMLDSARVHLDQVNAWHVAAPFALQSVDPDCEVDFCNYLYQARMGNGPAADRFLEHALREAVRLNALRLVLKYRKELAHRYRSQGAEAKAAEQALAYMRLNDSLQTVSDRGAIAAYEGTAKERESVLAIQEQRAKFEKQRLVMIGTIALAALLVLLVFVVARNNRLKQRTNRALDLARQRAEASEKFKQQFLANMSHEIRTPMNAIMGMSGILKRNEHTPEQEKYLNAISQSSENLLVILNDILDLSKLEAGKIDLEQMPFDPRQAINNVRDIIRFKAEEKGIALNVEVDDNVPALLNGDPTRLNQIVLNLAGNAVKFTERGSVTIRTAVKDLHPDRCMLAIDVIDTGIGIPADRLEKVFEEFTQAYSDTTRKYGGTGLGLTISKRLAEMQGGSISVKSEQGKGSTFTVTIPYVIDKGGMIVRDHVGAEDLPPLRDLRILLAEDNDFNAMVAQDELADAIPGVHVDVAANGRIAVEMASANDYDVILMDVQMPEMNGYDATRAIRALAKYGPEISGPHKAHVPIVAMTANVMKEEVERCTEAGMDGFIPKPFTREQLMSALVGALT